MTGVGLALAVQFLTLPPSATINLSNLTLSGGVFDAAAGATIDLTGSLTITGVLSGSGAGTFAFTGGTMSPGIGGATLNFTGSPFQWTGGNISGTLGNLTNDGTMVLDSEGDLLLNNDGTLFDFGTILQSGLGNLALHSDSQFPTTLDVEPGGIYDIEADSGIDNPNGGWTEVINEGTIEKTDGTGTSTLLVNGTLTNTGTIRALSGTLALSATIAELTGNTLTAGTWDASSGATLSFPSGTNITTNEADLTIDGAGASITGIAGLSSNSGSLAVTNGASFTTAGNFTNSGSLTLGAAAVMSVAGTYTQGAADRSRSASAARRRAVSSAGFKYQLPQASPAESAARP